MKPKSNKRVNVFSVSKLRCPVSVFIVILILGLLDFDRILPSVFLFLQLIDKNILVSITIESVS